MKKLLILSSLTLILGIPSNQTLEVNAASDPVIDSYLSMYTSLKTAAEITTIDDELPDPGVTRYENMGYRTPLLNIFNNEDESYNITSQLYPYKNYVKSSSSNGLDYIPIKDNEGNTYYNTLYYDSFTENIHIAKHEENNFMEFTIDITNLEYILESIVDTYSSKINQTTLFEVPLVKIDGQEIVGYLIDTSNKEGTNVYMYSNVGEIEINTQYGYEFLTFTMPYKPEIYNITLLNGKVFDSLDKVDAFSYATQSYSQFIPADWMKGYIKPFLFEVLEFDFENGRVTFGHSTHKYDNYSFKEDFNTYRPTYIDVTLYSATISETGNVGNYVEGTSYTFELTKYNSTDDTETYTLRDCPAGAFTSLIDEAGQVKVNKVDYYIGKDDSLNGTTYSHIYDNDQTSCNLFRFANIQTYKYYYIEPANYLANPYAFKELYTDYFNEEEINTNYSKNQTYLGSIYEPYYRMSNVTFGQCFAFNLTLDPFGYNKSNNIKSITLDYDDRRDDSMTRNMIFTEDDMADVTQYGYATSLSTGNNNIFINYQDESLLDESLLGYNEFNGTKYDYVIMYLYQPGEKEIKEYKPLKVRYIVEPYECTMVNNGNNYLANNNFVYSSTDESDPLFVERVDTPEDDNTDNNPSTNPGEDNNNTQDDENKPSIKDFFNKEDLKDNIKSILPIGLGIATIIAILALIFKKKK